MEAKSIKEDVGVSDKRCRSIWITASTTAAVKIVTTTLIECFRTLS
jgi:hypothetical protein